MTLLIISAVIVLAALLVLVTLAQMCYMENLRLRTRELPFQLTFKDSMEDRIGLKGDTGALAFSIVKHTTLVVLTVSFVAISGEREGINTSAVVEAILFSWITMLAATYVIPHLLYRRTSGRWLLPLVSILKGLAVLARPLTALMAFLQSLVQLGEPEE